MTFVPHIRRIKHTAKIHKISTFFKKFTQANVLN